MSEDCALRLKLLSFCVVESSLLKEGRTEGCYFGGECCGVLEERLEL